jgi:hypothetical protein
VGLRAGLDIEENLTSSGYDTWMVQPIVSRYIDYAIPATHNELKGTKNYNTPQKNQHHVYYLPLFLKQPSPEDDLHRWKHVVILM